MVISIIGAGYVGLTTSAVLAATGHKVYCIDVDSKKIETIKSGKSFFFEPGLDYFVKKGIDSGNLIPTLSYEESIPESEMIMICVGTPTNKDLEVDISYVIQATELVGKYMKDETIIIQKSTVPVGTGRKMEKILKTFKKEFYLVSCPEFLSEGTAVLDTLEVNRYVIGGDNIGAKNKVAKLFKTVDDYAKTIDFNQFSEYANLYRNEDYQSRKTPFAKKVLSISLESAELIKVTANAFLATKISFANSIARLCDVTGANIDEVMDGIGRDDRIGRSFLYAGLGWGGGCFPKDTAGLVSFSKKNDFDFPLLAGAIKTNFEQIDYVLEIIKDNLKGNFSQKVVAVLGLSFKPGTSDIRMSPALSLIKKMSNLKIKIKTFDPKAMDEVKEELNLKDVYYGKDVYDALEGADIIVLVTQWPEFKSIDFSKIRQVKKTQVLIDGRNLFNRKKIESLGFKYIGIGC